jgi:pilus assembly protein Flp/PilA
MNALRRLVIEEEGADATEYALLASLIAVALIVGAGALGGKINGAFSFLSTQLKDS